MRLNSKKYEYLLYARATHKYLKVLIGFFEKIV